MSSTILYLAIVAIWAGVLVPRWLRREPHQDTAPRGRRSARRTHRPADAHPGDDADDSGAQTADADSGDPAWAYSEEAGEHPAGAAGEADGGKRGRASSAAVSGQVKGTGAGRPPGGAPRSARVIAARRRLFTMLVLIFLAAAAVAAAGLAAWWVVLPPVGMLAGYVALLREAARADAELSRARVARYADRAALRRSHPAAVAGAVAGDALLGGAAVGQGAVGAGGAGAAGAAAGAGEAGRASQAGTAQVFDLTQRVAEEIYDQYADAKLRAVGD